MKGGRCGWGKSIASYRLEDLTVDSLGVNRNKFADASLLCLLEAAFSLSFTPSPNSLNQSYLEPGRMGPPPKQLAICPELTAAFVLLRVGWDCGDRPEAWFCGNVYSLLLMKLSGLTLSHVERVQQIFVE